MAEPLKLRQVQGLFADFHFFVQTTFFGQVANHGNVIGMQLAAVKNYFSFIGAGNLVNDADQRGFPGAVGAQQTENAAFGHGYACLVQGCEFAKFFGY